MCLERPLTRLEREAFDKNLIHDFAQFGVKKDLEFGKIDNQSAVCVDNLRELKCISCACCIRARSVRCQYPHLTSD